MNFTDLKPFSKLSNDDKQETFTRITKFSILPKQYLSVVRLNNRFQLKFMVLPNLKKKRV